MASPTSVDSVPFGRLHRPVVGDSFPGIVLIHDVWGPSEHSTALAADLASEGFGVLEIDLYRSMEAVEVEDPGTFIRALSDPEILADLEAASAWLRGEALCAGRSIGVMGVCMGGTYTLLAACLLDCFEAAAPFYGVLSYEAGMLSEPGGRDFERKPCSPIEAAPRLRVPLLAAFGAEDEFVPQSDVAALEAGLSASDRSDVQVDVYPGAGHAFLNRTREPAYRADASRDSWSRLIPFLHSRLD